MVATSSSLPPSSFSVSSAAIKGEVFPHFDSTLFATLKGKHRKILLQVPAGLVPRAHRFAEDLQRETGATVTLLARPCFGACDLPTSDEACGAEAAVVLGHAPIPNRPLPLPTYFVEMREADIDPGPLVRTLVASDVPRLLGGVFSIQHLDLEKPLRDALSREGITLRTSSGDARLAYRGQALGCNYSSVEPLAREVPALLFIGTGRFHPLGLALAVDRPVWSLDPLRNVLVLPVDRQDLVKRRLLRVAQASAVSSWGILVSTFVGQERRSLADALCRRAIRHGREATVVLFDRLDSRDLEGRHEEAYVNTACPRIATDDDSLYPKPILTPPEFLMALGELPLSSYRFDTFH